MDHHQNFCLQSLKNALENCDDDKEVDVDDGKKKESDYCCATNSDHCITQGAGNPICINGKYQYIYYLILYWN